MLLLYYDWETLDKKFEEVRDVDYNPRAPHWDQDVGKIKEMFTSLIIRTLIFSSR